MIDTWTRRQLLAAGAATGALWSSAPLRALTPAGTARIEALIARMTIAEKAGQLTIFPAALKSAAATTINPSAVTGSTEEQADQVRRGELGAIFNGMDAAWHRRMQDVAMRESRLRIPLLFAADVIHGFRTIFPIPLAEAASFDLALIERTARAAAVEAAARGIAWTFAPMVDIARDARWGRVTEGAGEDVVLGCRIAAARVRGFQGKHGLTAPDAVAATVKHFAAYGAAEGGVDYNTVDVSERTLRETYLPPFRAGLDAGAPTVMAAFNELSGIPAHANPWLLQTILRQEWQSDALVVSDYTGDLELIDHGLAKDERDAARLSLLAGVDMSMASGLFRKYIPDLVAAGEVPVARVDEAVRRVLILKDRLGLFDAPYNRLPAKPKAAAGPAHRPLAREAATKAAVLLKNDGGLLPLPRRGRKIALIGPEVTSTADQVGSWVIFGDAADNLPLDRAFRAMLADPNDLIVARGSANEQAIPDGIATAVAAAQAADVIILAIGEAQTMAGESKSRAEVVVPAPQQALAEALAATGKPMIVLLKTGRALALSGAVAAAPAILVTWFLGTEQSAAIADLVFGAAGPSGRLPVSFPRLSGQTPFYYDHKPTGRPAPIANTPGVEYRARLLETAHTAAYAFGHGLTYGAVTYSPVLLDGPSLDAEGTLTARATIANRSARAVIETVQLYIRDRAASVTRPVRQLKDFRQIALAPGAEQEVRFTLRRSDLLFVGRDDRWTVEPGSFDLWIAPSADAGTPVRFELTGSS